MLHFRFIIFTLILFGTQAIFAQDPGYARQTAEPHFFLITMTSRSTDIHDVRTEITKYVWSHHKEDKLQLTHILLGENRDIGAMLIQTFRDESHAKRFL